jgi:hypothetical protein
VILKIISLKWAVSWMSLALLIFISTVLLCAPLVPIVYLLWNWIAVKLGLPPLSFVETAGLMLLARLLQASITMTNQTAEKAAKQASEVL